MPGEATARNWPFWARTLTIPPLTGKTAEAKQHRPTLATRLVLLTLAALADAQGIILGLGARDLARRCGISRATAQRQLAFLKGVGLLDLLPSVRPDGGTAPPTIFLDAMHGTAFAMASATAAADGPPIVPWAAIGGGNLGSSHEAGPPPHDRAGRSQAGAPLWQVDVPLSGTGQASPVWAPPRGDWGQPQNTNSDAIPPASFSASTARASSLTSLVDIYKDDQGSARAATSPQAEIARLLGEVETFLNQQLLKIGQQLTLALKWTDLTAEGASDQPSQASSVAPASRASEKSEPASRRETTATLVTEALIAEMIETYRDRLTAEYVRKAIAKCEKFGGRELAADPRARLTWWLDHDIEMGAGQRVAAHSSGKANGGKHNVFAVHHAEPDPDFIHPFASLWPDTYGRRNV